MGKSDRSSVVWGSKISSTVVYILTSQGSELVPYTLKPDINLSSI